MLPLMPLLQVISPANKNARLSVLIFHRVHRKPDPLFPGEPDAEFFDKALGWIKSWFNVLPLDEAVSKLKTQSLPARAAAITFDDGYADNYRVALPILKKHGLTATFFVTTGFIDGGIMWNDCIIELIRRTSLDELNFEDLGLGRYTMKTLESRRSAIGVLIPQLKYRDPTSRQVIVDKCTFQGRVVLPADLMMTSEEVRLLHRAGMQIGAHTVTHPILASIDLTDARKEIEDSKNYLENLLDERVGLFAYPNGKPGADYLPSHVSLVKRLDFDGAVSTAHGCASDHKDSFEIPRFTPWNRTEFRFGIRLALNYWK